jgi:nascent polypeptide-associated complex subunit alpha
MSAAAAEKAAVIEEDVPALEAVEEGDKGDKTSGKQAKRYAKAMAKMGLKPEANIVRVMIRKNQGISFAISKPEVYRFPGTNTFVIFGETQLEDAGTDAQKAAARTVAGAAAPTPAAAAPAAAAAAGGDDDNEDATGLQEKEINVVMAQASVSRGKAIRALRNNNGDIVNAIMELTM